MQTKYTNIRADRPIIPHVVKKDLTPALSMLIDQDMKWWCANFLDCKTG